VTINHVEANGVRFAYLEEGTGPLVLMIHGFPDTPQTWDAARPAVARAGFRVVTPFTRGYHPTAVPADGDYTTEALARDVLALVDALGETSCILVGHDWGAAAAYRAAVLGPDKIKKLITLAIPHPAALVPNPVLVWRIRHFFSLKRKGAADKIRRRDYVHIDELVQRWSPAWKVPGGETDAVKAAFREAGCLEAALGYYAAFKPGIPPDQRKKIAMPAVAFAGDTDIVPPKLYEKARRFYASSYEIVSMPGGHFMHREHPERFVSELVRVVTA
jgi:pimeloyl-ACP methyl ester carboxylesterase